MCISPAKLEMADQVPSSELAQGLQILLSQLCALLPSLKRQRLNGPNGREPAGC